MGCFFDIFFIYTKPFFSYYVFIGGWRGGGGAPKRDVVIYEWFPSTDNIEMTGDS